MRHFLRQRHLIAWVAMLSILFGALAPAISHAMAAAAPATEEVQLCTMKGMVTLVVPKAQSGKPAVPASDHVAKHCTYCAAHGGAASPPPVAACIVPGALPAIGHPPLFYRAAAPQFAWRAAQPRAPPAHA